MISFSGSLKTFLMVDCCDMRKGFNGLCGLVSDSAIIYSIIESCRRHHIEPYTYLRDVLTRLPTMTNRQIKDIVPKAWAATRNTAPRAA